MTTEELTVALPSDMAEAVRKAVADGDYSSASAVVRAALRDWTTKQGQRAEAFAALKADIEHGLADIEAGRVKDFDVDAIARQGRRRLTGR